MNSRRICFIQYNLQGGGAERKICTLANFFVQQGYDVEIGLFGVNEVAYKLDDRVKVTYLRRVNYEYRNPNEKIWYSITSFLIKIISTLVSLFSKKFANRINLHFDRIYNYTLPVQRFILNRQDSVFITMMVSTYLEVLRIMGKYWAEEITVPYLVMDCNDPKRNADGNINEKRNIYYPRADRILVMTQEAKNYFNDEIKKKCVIIPNPIRSDLPELYTGSRRKIVVDYCRLNEQKNLPLLIKAFSIFHSVNTEYILEIIGQGSLIDELNSLIDNLGLTEFVQIKPFDSKIHEKIRDYAMFVSSSDYEGFPNSVMEAMAIGLPTISTDCDFGPRDMIKDHVNGLLTPVGDVQALANAMSEIADNPSLASQLSHEAIKIRDLYNVETIGQRWLDLIDEVAKERGLE